MNKEKLLNLWETVFREVIKPIKARMNPYMMRAAVRLGGFIGWYFSVLRIGEIKLNDVYADSMSTMMKASFLGAEFITLAIIMVILTFYDVEKLITHKYIKLMPGIFLAEGSIALALTDVHSVITLSSIAGITSAIGSAAILTSLLKVKKRYRLAAIGGGLAIAGVLYMISCNAIPAIISNTSVATLVSGIFMAVVTILTVHFERFTGNKTKVINRFDEEGRKEIAKKLPYEYIVFIVICTAFFFAFNSSYIVADMEKPLSYRNFDLMAMLAFVITACVITFFVRPHSVCPLFAGGAAVAGSAAILLNVNVISETEIGLFAFFSYVGLACFRACVLLFVSTFALDRPHPLFFSIVGYTSLIFSEVLAQYLVWFIEPTKERTNLYTIIFFVLLPVGYFLISHGLARNGYSEDAFESRHRRSQIFKEIMAGTVMSKREKAVARYLLIDELDVTEIRYRLYISENSVNNYIKRVLAKTGETSVEALLEKFNEDQGDI